jgi:hypothetical protein
MNTAEIVPIHSPEFSEIKHFFHVHKPPYGLEHIFRFNRLYKRVYSQLNKEERRRSEEFVDKLIDELEDPRLASKIFGVV